MYKFVLTLLLLNFCSFGQTQKWIWVNPYPTGAQINQACFLDDQNGFAIGSQGTLLRTADGGTTWANIDLGVPSNLIKISFSDPANGRILGHDDYSAYPNFFRTTDGGLTWTASTITAFYSAIDMFFLNSQYGWCLGNEGKLFKTTDGGENWLDKSLSTTSGLVLSRVLFKNENEGYIIGTSYGYNYTFLVASTINGGNSWNYETGPYIGMSLSANLLDDSTTILTSAEGMLLRSTDNYASWTFRMNTPRCQYTSMDFMDSQNGIIGADSGNVLLTSDGGFGWNKINTGFPITYYSVQYLSPDFLSATGRNPWSAGASVIATSTDHGNSWINHTRYIENQLSVYGIEPIDSLTVFICGSLNYNDGYIYKTSNAGITWQLVYYSPNNGLSCIKSLNDNLIFAGGSNYNQGIILKSVDGGLTWTTTTVNTSSPVRKLALCDSTSLYALSDLRLLKSTNLGASWSIQYQPSGVSFTDMEFCSPFLGYCLDGNYTSRVHKTTDGGNNWTISTVTPYYYTYHMTFPSETLGYVISNNTVYKTTDGGVSWYELSTPSYAYSNIVFNDNMNGWLIGGDGIYKTSDGGQNWELEFSQILYDSFKSFGLKRGSVLWTGGFYGYLIRYTPELPTALAEEHGSDIPKEFSLLQNYPNPFNPTTKIRYDVPKETKVVLKIYDILGAEVATLINQNIRPGRYSAEWNARNFASGVYIYRMEADGFSSSKKLMLIK